MEPVPIVRIPGYLDLPTAMNIPKTDLITRILNIGKRLGLLKRDEK